MNRLTWNEIKSQYKDEWVQLIDVDWDPSETDPTSGVVRIHHKDKVEFKRLLAQGDRPNDAALVYTGELFPEGRLFSVNLHQVVIQRS